MNIETLTRSELWNYLKILDRTLDNLTYKTATKEKIKFSIYKHQSKKPQTKKQIYKKIEKNYKRSALYSNTRKLNIKPGKSATKSSILELINEDYYNKFSLEFLRQVTRDNKTFIPAEINNNTYINSLILEKLNEMRVYLDNEERYLIICADINGGRRVLILSKTQSIRQIENYNFLFV